AALSVSLTRMTAGNADVYGGPVRVVVPEAVSSTRAALNPNTAMTTTAIPTRTAAATSHERAAFRLGPAVACTGRDGGSMASGPGVSWAAPFRGTSVSSAGATEARC